MENAPRLYDAVFEMLGQQRYWRDVCCHLKTLVWMVVGEVRGSTTYSFEICVLQLYF